DQAANGHCLDAQARPKLAIQQLGLPAHRRVSSRRNKRLIVPKARREADYSAHWISPKCPSRRITLDFRSRRSIGQSKIQTNRVPRLEEATAGRSRALLRQQEESETLEGQICGRTWCTHSRQKHAIPGCWLCKPSGMSFSSIAHGVDPAAAKTENRRRQVFLVRPAFTPAYQILSRSFMLAYVVLLLAVVSRILPHAFHNAGWNFTAVSGGLLCSGSRMHGSKRAPVMLASALAALIATDYYLTVYAYGYAFHAGSYLVTWLWYAAVCLLGMGLLEKPSVLRVGAGALASSTSFFLVSNLM